MRALIFFLLLPSLSFACPKEAPAGYEETPGQAARSYHNKEKTVTISLKCDSRVSAADAQKALALFGEVHNVDKTVSYVDVKKGVMRIYVSTLPTITQAAVVAKTPDALDKAAPALVDYLKH